MSHKHTQSLSPS